MSYDNEWLNQILEARKQSVRETIHPATVEEIRALGSARFPSATDPWAENFKTFLDEHPRGEFYLAKTHEGAEIAYCHDAGKAVWFLEGRGCGPVQARGLAMLAEIVASL
jgi:hypothetical protein